MVISARTAILFIGIVRIRVFKRKLAEGVAGLISAVKIK